jgi:hypothetical protein
MAPRAGFGLRCLLGIGVLALAASACAPKPSGDVDKIQITIGRFDVSVKNLTGQALFNVKVAIQKTGNPAVYSRQLPRLENAEVATCDFNSLKTENGSSFSPRVVKASFVVVTAKDINGTALTAQIPWKVAN